MSTNTYTALVNTAKLSLATVAREQNGFIRAVSRDARADQAELNEQLPIPRTQAATTQSLTPAMTLPAMSGQTFPNRYYSLDNMEYGYFVWEGEEAYALDPASGIVNHLQNNQIEEIFRSLSGKIDLTIANLAVQASRSYGVVGTTPFATKFTELAHAKRLLKDNGAPLSDLRLVTDTMTGVNVEDLVTVATVDQAGQTVRKPLGFVHSESANITEVAAGTGASATTDTVGYAVGATIITLASAGTGTILETDIISFAGDAEKYHVAPSGGNADVSAGGTIVLQSPGLRKAIPASATAITVTADSTRNLAFSSRAILLGTRLPKRPVRGDLATESFSLRDPVSGIFYDIARYPGFHMEAWMVSVGWGATVVEPNNIMSIHY